MNIFLVNTVDIHDQFLVRYILLVINQHPYKLEFVLIAIIIVDIVQRSGDVKIILHILEVNLFLFILVELYQFSEIVLALVILDLVMAVLTNHVAMFFHLTSALYL